MVDAVRELARRMLADYHATTPGQVFAEPLDLTTVQMYCACVEWIAPAPPATATRRLGATPLVRHVAILLGASRKSYARRCFLRHSHLSAPGLWWPCYSPLQ